MNTCTGLTPCSANFRLYTGKRRVVFWGILSRNFIILVHACVDISTWYVVNFNQIGMDLSISDTCKLLGKKSLSGELSKTPPSETDL